MRSAPPAAQAAARVVIGDVGRGADLSSVADRNAMVASECWSWAFHNIFVLGPEPTPGCGDWLMRNQFQLLSRRQRRMRRDKLDSWAMMK